MPYVNYITTAAGKVRAVCECCGWQSKPVEPDDNGEPKDWKLAPGWSTAPFPHEYTHKDGSNGSFFTCPDCSRLLQAGHKLKLRDYPAPECDHPGHDVAAELGHGCPGCGDLFRG